MAAAPTAATPWVERYRPESLSDVSHQTEIVSTLQNAVETNRLPHLLFYGPPGTGKTSVALALCRQLWHPSQLRRRVLELNASDERGISVVRNKIKHFAGLAVGSSSGAGAGFFQKKDGNHSQQEGATSKKYPNPPFKIVILDEADTVTPDAQAALRRIIEAHSKITRFVLICNYVTRIIEPLASRCAKFRFQPLPPASMKERLRFIARSEQCRFSTSPDNQAEKEDGVIDEILALSQGDMRRAVTTLQSAHTLSGASNNIDSEGRVIEKESIAEMAGLPPKTIITSLLSTLRANSFDQMETAVLDIIAEGYSAQDVLKALSKEIISMENLDDLGKARISIRIAEADKNLVDGADEVLQLLNVCSLAVRCLSNRSDSKET